MSTKQLPFHELTQSIANSEGPEVPQDIRAELRVALDWSHAPVSITYIPYPLLLTNIRGVPRSTPQSGALTVFLL
jgi:hypothetical protein